MPQNVASFTYTANQVVPLYGEDYALETAVNLAPATFFAAGTVLGNVSNAAADVQTFTATGTPTGGTFAYTVYNPLNGTSSTLTIAYNETSTTLQTKLNAIFGAGNTVATGGTWPGTALVVTGAGALLNVPIPLAVAGTNAFTGGTSPASTDAHTTVGRSASTYGAYASGNSDGTQTPMCVLKYDCTTDASGRIVFGNVATGVAVANIAGQHGATRAEAPAYFRGDFDVLKLVGIDATGLTNGKWRMQSGVIGGPGVVRIP